MFRAVGALTVLLTIALTGPAVAGTDAGEPAWTGDRSLLLRTDTVDAWRSPSVDVPVLLKEDDENLGDPDIPWRVGFPMEVDLSPANSGSWEDLPNGGQLWRLNIVTEDALWTVLGFDVFHTRPRLGGELRLDQANSPTLWRPRQNSGQ